MCLDAAFCGTARGVGTSANLTALAAGLTLYYHIPVQTESICKPEAKLRFIDCSRRPCQEAVRIAEKCDLIVINFSASDLRLEEMYLQFSSVRKDIIFLIGKYYPDKQKELEQLARLYRLPRGSVCAIPYNVRFGQAYENRHILRYFERQKQGAGSYEDETFHTALKQAMRAVLNHRVFSVGDDFYD